MAQHAAMKEVAEDKPSPTKGAGVRRASGAQASTQIPWHISDDNWDGEGRGIRLSTIGSAGHGRMVIDFDEPEDIGRVMRRRQKR